MTTGILGAVIPSGLDEGEPGLLLAKVSANPDGDLVLDESDPDTPHLDKEPEIKALPALPTGPALARSRGDVTNALLKLLAGGIETYFGGLFLLIPFLLQIRVQELAGALCPGKEKCSRGLTSLQAMLAIFFTAISGLKNLSKVGAIQDPGIAIAAGLPRLPSGATLHQYLNLIETKVLDELKLKTARILKRIGMIRGRIVNIDIHVSEYFGDQKLPEGHHGTKKKSVKCWCTMAAQDQDTNNPIYYYVYLRHQSIFEILPGFINKVRSIVGGAPWFTLVFDREFFKGEFFAQLLQMPKTKFITIAKNYKTIVEQLERVPESAFNKLCEGKDLATTYINITDCAAPLRLLVIKLLDSGKLIGLITNDEKTAPEILVLRYARRWRIENFFKDIEAFLKLDHMPGIRQVKIDSMLYIKFLAFSMFNYLRQQLGGQFASMNIESIYDALLHKKAHVQLVGDRLIVRFAYFKGQETVIERYRNLDAKLRFQNIDPRIPWLGNAMVTFVFEDKDGIPVS